jgi:predicted RNase H-like HicB family nuclease
MGSTRVYESRLAVTLLCVDSGHNVVKIPQKSRRRTMSFVVLTFRFEKEESEWLGECVELGTCTWASTLEEVQVELKDLVTLHLNVLERGGEREPFFLEHGIKLYEGDKEGTSWSWSSPVYADSGATSGPLYQPNAFPLPVSPDTMPATV